MSDLITGCAGFIGGHMMRDYAARRIHATGLDRRPVPASAYPFHEIDIRRRACVTEGLGDGVFRSVIHLAAIGEVMVPFPQADNLYETNVAGTFHLLSAASTCLFIFASSSSVYGHCGSRAADPRRDNVSPVGSYGMTKAGGELLCRDWALESASRTSVCLRLANVIGSGCRGLMRYVAEHAVKHPDGRVPARLRGAGKLIRDYVPVETVVQAIRLCSKKNWSGPVHTLNVSSGIALSNGAIVEILRPELASAGLKLNVDWSSAPGSGEARETLLDPSLTEETLELERPALDAIVESVRQSIRSILETNAEAAPCGY